MQSIKERKTAIRNAAAVVMSEVEATSEVAKTDLIPVVAHVIITVTTVEAAAVQSGIPLEDPMELEERTVKGRCMKDYP